MTAITTILAADTAPPLPLDGKLGPLAPSNYDIVWSIIPLVVILFLFWKLVLPKFSAVLAEREEKIEGGIRRAEESQAEAKAALEQYRAQLAEARTEAAKIREDARAQGQRIIDEMKTQAQAESDRIVAAGSTQLEAQRSQIIAELRSEMGQTAVTLAERLMGEQLDSELKQASTIDRFLAEIDSFSGTPAGK